MSKNVQMVAKVGDEVLSLGSTHPATARKLVKQELAAWDDGKLLVLIRPTFLGLLDSNESSWKGPLDDENVSDAELRRRREWFKTFIPKAAEALVPHGSDLEQILNATDEALEQARREFDPFIISGKLTDEEADPWYTDTDEPLTDVPWGFWGEDQMKLARDAALKEYGIPLEAEPYREVEAVVEDYEYVVLPMSARYKAGPVTHKVIIKRAEA